MRGFLRLCKGKPKDLHINQGIYFSCTPKERYCRNLVKKAWAYKPQIVGFIYVTPKKRPRLLNQVSYTKPPKTLMVPFKGTRIEP